MNSAWLPFFYQYSICFIFFIGSILIAVNKKAISLTHPIDRKVLIEIILGFLFFIALHASMIVFAGVSL